MALTDSNAPAFDPASLRPDASLNIPYDALARLPQLHGEAGRNLATAAFLARSPQASVLLMGLGAAALLMGGGTLKADFAWAALVLIGIVAMTRNYIRGFARSLRRVPLAEAASDLRALLLYTGAAWGIGAFLVMPDLPAPALAFCFAVLPSLGLALILKDASATLAFVGPVTVAGASAAVLGAWPLEFWVAAAIMASGAATILVSFARRAKSVA
jgi:hypothetical protein